MRIANAPHLKEQDYRTLRQWLSAGRLTLDDMPGEQMHTNGFCQHQSIYWAKSETREAALSELESARRKIREEDNARRREAYCRKRVLEGEMEESRKAMELVLKEQEQALNRKAELLAYAANLPAIPCVNPSGIIVFDLETTGLDPSVDEILQIAAIDGDGNTLVNSYLRPYVQEYWPAAEAVNGITPDMVKDAPELHELLPVLKGIFESAKLLVSFDTPHR